MYIGKKGVNVRKYYPKSIIFYLFMFFLIIFLSLATYVFMSFILNSIKASDVKNWIAFVSSCFAVVYIGYVMLRVGKRIIIIRENSIVVSNDIGGKDIKLQYGFDIRFNDIQSIGITVDSNNSLNQHMRFVITPMPNIVLYLNNGKEARINVYYYSKKQAIEIINHIIEEKKLINPTFTNKSGQQLIEGLKNAKI